MKCIVVCFLFAVTLTCCLAAKRCRKGEDCDPGQCCIARHFGFSKGDCTDLAKLDEGCNSEDYKLFHFDEYFMHCPCAPGLTCEPTDVKEIPFIGTIKIDERCVEGTTTIKPEEPTLPPTSEPEVPKE